MVTGVIPSPPRFLPSIFIANRVQQSHCSSIVHRMLLTHALALSASQFVHKKKSQRIYTSMHLAGLELTKLTYTRLEDNLIRHRGDRLYRSATPPYNYSVAIRINRVMLGSLCAETIYLYRVSALVETRVDTTRAVGHNPTAVMVRVAVSFRQNRVYPLSG